MSLRVWAMAAAVCWFVAVVIIALPVVSVGGHGCGQALEATYRGPNCADGGWRRLDWLLTWLILTAPITLGYLARVASRRPE